jgi:hypothetical protein
MISPTSYFRERLVREIFIDGAVLVKVGTYYKNVVLFTDIIMLLLFLHIES